MDQTFFFPLGNVETKIHFKELKSFTFFTHFALLQLKSVMFSSYQKIFNSNRQKSVLNVNHSQQFEDSYVRKETEKILFFE